MSNVPPATVAVIPRETLSQVRGCLEAIVANTPPPYRLVIVDACRSRRSEQWIDQFARSMTQRSFDRTTP